MNTEIKTGDEILKEAITNSGLYFDNDGRRMLLVSKAVKSINKYLSQFQSNAGNVWVNGSLFKDDLDDFAKYHWRYADDHIKLDTDLFEYKKGSLHKIDGTVFIEFQKIEWLDETFVKSNELIERKIGSVYVYDNVSKDIPKYFSLIKSNVGEGEKYLDDSIEYTTAIHGKYEVESCECGHTAPLEFIVYDSEGCGTCLNCFRDLLVYKLEKEKTASKKLRHKIKSLRSTINNYGKV